MRQQFFKTINIDDFQQGEFIPYPFSVDNLNILAQSIKIKVIKNNQTVQIIPVLDVDYNVNLTNFTIKSVINEDDDNLVCCFNWDTFNNDCFYLLYQNDEIYSINFKLNNRIDFKDYEDGEYIYQLQAFDNTPYIKYNELDVDINNVNFYSYLNLDIPILFGYKYYFYYYIENSNEDTFQDNLLCPIGLDTYAVQAIQNYQSFDSLENHSFVKDFNISKMKASGVYFPNNEDEYYSFDNTDFSNAKYPFSHFALVLNQPKGVHGITPIIKKIDIFIEKIELGGEE